MTQTNAAKKNILFADDERALRLVGERFLKKLGYDVVIVQTGAEALATFKANPQRFDLVITDQNMPEMLGLEFAAEVRKTGSKVPIILATGFADSTDMDEARKLSITEVLHKPYGTDVLSAALRKAFGDRVT